MKLLNAPWILLSVLSAGPLPAEEKVDLLAVTRIRDEGFNRSQVMDTAWHLTDRYGPRLTGSPAFKAGGEWACAKLREWGLEGARLEPWGEFGKGWSFEKVCLEMTEPAYMPMVAIPEAWTPGTAGVITGQPILIRELSIEDLEPHKGKLAGKIILAGEARDAEAAFEPPARRYGDQDLEDLVKAPDPSGRPSFSSPLARPPARTGSRQQPRAPRAERESVADRLRAEGVAAVLRPGSIRGNFVVTVAGGGSYRKDAKPGVPSLVVAIEHYNRLARLLQRKVPVSVSLEVKATFHEQDLTGFNVVAEIPGVDPQLKREVVMLGAHFDTWHAGTGATDNGCGCVVVMEAARILKALGLQPRRTIRLALWGGEEQGLLGSQGYVKNHFAEREKMELKEEHGLFSAYFNLDNGAGKIRGIYCQSNAAVRPIFAAWLEPFHDLDATAVTIRNTGGTDHQSFDRVGLPGFQFIQEPLDYSSRTHHTNLDTYERIIPGDLMQASVVMASFVYHAAMRDEKLPRKPLPKPQPRREEEKKKDEKPAVRALTTREL